MHQYSSDWLREARAYFFIYIYLYTCTRFGKQDFGFHPSVFPLLLRTNTVLPRGVATLSLKKKRKSRTNVSSRAANILKYVLPKRRQTSATFHSDSGFYCKEQQFQNRSWNGMSHPEDLTFENYCRHEREINYILHSKSGTFNQFLTHFFKPL